MEWSRPQKLACMHFTSTSTCINFLSRFYLLTPMVCRKGNLAKSKNEQNLQYWSGHTHQNWFACISHQPLFTWIFWVNSIFWPHGLKGKFGPFLKANQKEQNLQNQRGHAHQIGLHAFHINLYLLFEPILFLTPGKSHCPPLVPTQKINKFCKLIVAYVNEVTTIGHVPECLPDWPVDLPRVLVREIDASQWPCRLVTLLLLID